MPSTWIDFQALREQLDLADVLEHYGVTIKHLRGDQFTCLCPLPDHPVRHDRGKRTASFSGNVRKGIWQCFGCGASGNCIDLALLMEGKDPDDREAVREVALHLADVFNLQFEGPPATKPSRQSEGREQPQRFHQRRSNTKKKAMDASTSTAFRDRAKGHSAQFTATANEHIAPDSVREDEKSLAELVPDRNLPVVINPPLGFALQHLDATHPYLASRGLTSETIAHFGLGHCSRGMLSGRIAIPLHDPTGVLVGYAGRIVDDKLISDEVPKYLFPGSREREGKRIEFRKSALLYNVHQIVPPVDRLIVVEGFPSVWWLHQHGWKAVIALMGSSCSEQQELLLHSLLRGNSELLVFTDGDDAGRHAASEIFLQLGHRWRARYVRLEDGEQPTDLGMNELAAIL